VVVSCSSEIVTLCGGEGKGEYGVTDSVQIGPVQIGEVTGPDPVHLRLDRAFTTSYMLNTYL